MCEKALIKTLENLILKTEPPEESKSETETPIIISKKIKITRTSKSGNVLIIDSGNKPEPTPNPYLINAIVKSHYWNKLILEGKVKSSKDIQKLEGVKDNTYVKDILRLRFLPPTITEEILNGTQPHNLSVQKLFNS